MQSQKISKNLLFLGAIQLMNYVVPLILVPILVKRVGLENFGIISLAQGIMFLFIAFTDFGLNIIGTRLISQSKSTTELARITYNALMSKIVLLPTGLLLLVIVIHLVPTWQRHIQVIIYSYTMAIGTSLLPTWYFLGLGKTATLSLFNFCAKILYVSGVLIFVQKASDLHLVNFINGLSTSLVAVVSLLIIYKRTETNFSLVFQYKSVLNFLKSNTSIFLGTFVNNGYRSSAMLLAGFILSPTLLGIYSILDKLIMMIIAGFVVLFSAVFPKVCQLVSLGHIHLRHFLRKNFPVLSVVIILSSLALILLGPCLIEFLIQDVAATDTQNFIFLLAIIPLVLLLNLPVSLSLTALNLKKDFFIYNLIAWISILLLGSLLGNAFHISGILLSIIISEIIIFIFGYYALVRHNFPLI